MIILSITVIISLGVHYIWCIDSSLTITIIDIRFKNIFICAPLLIGELFVTKRNTLEEQYAKTSLITLQI